MLTTDVLISQKPFVYTIQRQNDATCEKYDPAYVSLAA